MAWLERTFEKGKEKKMNRDIIVDGKKVAEVTDMSDFVTNLRVI